MPPDSPPKKTSDFQNPISGLFGKFLNLPATLSVRVRRDSDQESIKPTMSTANSNEKKRKRSSRSLRSSSRIAPKIAESQVPLPGSNFDMEDHEAVWDHFKANKSRSKDNVQKRTALVQAEIADSWDHGMIDQKNKTEKDAATIVQVLRKYERKFVFGNLASEAVPGPDTRDMGGQFLTNRVRIEKNSELFNISKEVPKGAILHLHYNAELNPERLLIEARKMPNMYVWSIRPLLSQKDLDETEMQFKIMPADTKSNNIFSGQYMSGLGESRGKKIKPLDTIRPLNHDNFKNRVWMRWDEFRDRFEVEFPGLYKQSQENKNDNQRSRTCSDPDDVELKPAEYWMMQKMILSEKEAYEPAQTVNGVWARFNQATRCFKGLLNYQTVYEWYIGNAIERMIDEKIMYAELRPMLLDKSIPSDDGKSDIDLEAQMTLIAGFVEKKRNELKARGEGHKFPFGLKIIYCTPRSIPVEKMELEMKHCIKLKREFPDLICGFDLVGAEDRPNHIGFYHEQFATFQNTCEALNIEIPFMFHAGETLLDTGGSEEFANSNLYDAVTLNAKRIGHGFSLMKHPQLIEKFREHEVTENGKKIKRPGSGICVELCPISNELLHLCRNIKEHPYPQLLAAKVPCCVNSDNPSLFSNSMSHEFYQILVGSPTISIYSWKQLALWSLEYSCLTPAQITEAKAYFEVAWKEFCQCIVDKYGHLVKDGEINTEAAEKMYGPPILPPEA